MEWKAFVEGLMVIFGGGEGDEGRDNSDRFTSHPPDSNWRNRWCTLSIDSLWISVDAMSEISTARRQAKGCSTGERSRVFFTRVGDRVS